MLGPFLGVVEKLVGKRFVFFRAFATGTSAEMVKLAGAKIRIPDGEWAYEVINGFADGRLDANWSRCGLPATDFNARDMGGDSRRSAAILARVSGGPD